MKIFNSKHKKEFRQSLRCNPTPAELILWSHLRGSQIGVKFRRQHSIGDYIVDFYCPSFKLAIELDGDTHFSESEVYYDKIRDSYLISLQIRVIRFTNHDIYYNLEGVIGDIKLAISEPHLTSP